MTKDKILKKKSTEPKRYNHTGCWEPAVRTSDKIRMVPQGQCPQAKVLTIIVD